VSATKKLALAAVLIVVALIAYYLIARQIYLRSAKSAFPQLPIDANSTFLPWPAGPSLVGHLTADDPMYLQRDSIEKSSEGLRLIIHDSDGTFLIKPE
jgi:hypothetical protein